jgi:hypothetical protein
VSNTIFGEFGWLHDSDVRGMTTDFGPDGVRYLRIFLDCPEVAGHPLWSGQKLVFLAHDVRMLNYEMWGGAEPESLDSIEPQISEVMAKVVERARLFSSQYQGQEISIAFHSGSKLEMVCEGVSISIDKR